MVVDASVSEEYPNTVQSHWVWKYITGVFSLTAESIKYLLSKHVADPFHEHAIDSNFPGAFLHDTVCTDFDIPNELPLAGCL